MKRDGAGQSAPPESSRSRVLVVDDEPMLLEAIAQALRLAGHDVRTALNGHEAVVLLDAQKFDAIVSDVRMPGMDGIQFLRAVRERDNDVPVVLMTGGLELETAIDAVTFGAMQYLLKPFESEALKTVVARAVSLCRIARIKKEAFVLSEEGGLGASDRAGLEVSFGRALDTLWMAYQPIVKVTDHTPFGYEALVRCDGSTLPSPEALLDAASRLGRSRELGAKIRAAAASPMPSAPDGTLLFLNVQAAELNDPELLSPDAPLCKWAHRVVLEITERASLDAVDDPRAVVSALREMGFRIAIDDLGVGYAGLSTFAAIEPQFVKLDGSLVRGVDKNPTRQRLIKSMTKLCRDLGIATIAEGVETVWEREMLVELGCDLLQGYLLAKPDKPFPPVSW
jgi:EAL domain-containing protein (putative c-di-GMP-specific phosphodiesterase class I)/ActR/RegA family two-component response regulator